MKRNSAIDYLKFIFSIIIFLYHFGLGFHGGYIVVEGFFMISGYLMYASLKKKKEQDELPDSTARFVWNKYKALFLPLLFSAISGFLIYDLIIYTPTLQESLLDIPLLTFEVFPLQSAGFKARYTTGVSWYVSAMLLAIAILHPIFKKNPDKAAYTVCPTMSLLIYGFMRATYGHLGITVEWALGFLNTGLLRAVAGISAGFFLGALLQRVRDWEPPTRVRVLLSAVELTGIVALILGASSKELSYTHYDLVWTALQFGIFWIAFSGKAWHTPHVSGKYTKVLSSISLYLFLNHVPWCMYFKDQHTTVEESFRVLPRISLCVAASCLAVWGMTVLTRLLIKKCVAKRAEKKAA